MDEEEAIKAIRDAFAARKGTATPAAKEAAATLVAAAGGAAAAEEEGGEEEPQAASKRPAAASAPAPAAKVAKNTTWLVGKKSVEPDVFKTCVKEEVRKAGLSEFNWDNVCKKLGITEGSYNRNVCKNVFERQWSKGVELAVWFGPGGEGELK